MNCALALSFFVAALLYAVVGFGGGSTYTALLVLSGIDYRILPTIALSCNIIVVTGGVWHFSRNGHLSLQRIAPFLFASIPAAWIGGRLFISETVFVSLLGASLFVAGIQMLFHRKHKLAAARTKISGVLKFIIGALIGLLSGLVGIGGGIFLAPILYYLSWGSSQQIAAACSFFILVNSISGLTGQTMKLNDHSMLLEVATYWPLAAAVFIGGNIGSWLGAAKFSSLLLKKLTAILVLYVSIRLLFRGWSLLAALQA